MIADRPLRLGGHALAPLGEIEPLFRQLQQAALVDSGCGFVRAVDHFGGGQPIDLQSPAPAMLAGDRVTGLANQSFLRN
jgi:hypothetical protein